MDDNFVLNIIDDQASAVNVKDRKKGGRWTERVKAKRVSKRKLRPEETTSPKTIFKDVAEAVPRPSKRARIETANKEHHRPPAQIISSLFSRNPQVEAPEPPSPQKVLSKPSNAPLDDSSFTGLGLNPLITAHLDSKMSIHKPTSIQRAVLSALLPTLSEESPTRDVFIQSQTGSGKTLSFLLPIIQDLLPLSSESYIDRSVGTLAIIISPTRELAKQISDVLEVLLKLRLRPEQQSADDPVSATRLTRWLVSGLLIGGATRAHEKSRLRKGVPILVSTPGRLLDHLQNTSSFNTGKCRWLVLDEADRLMELGFEETITGIIGGLDGRRRLALKATKDGKGMEFRGWDLNYRRRTILCSATIREDVQKLAGTVLVHPLVVRDTQSVQLPNKTLDSGKSVDIAPAISAEFTPPSQLVQKYVVVPLKLRLVALVALLRSLLAQSQSRTGAKIVVFLSCTDSVDFHWRLLSGVSMDGDSSNSSHEDEGSDGTEDVVNLIKHKTGEASTPLIDEGVEAQSSLLPDTSIFRLHGSLPTSDRLRSLRGFSAERGKSNVSKLSILLCTSVASRGLDLPLVRAVVQYDLPTEGGATEYVHRVGRTARAGNGGEAWSIIAPSEAEWVKWVERKMKAKTDAPNTGDDVDNVRLQGVTIESVLASGFGGKGNEYEERATDVQLSFERWVLRRKEHTEIAHKAFLSHMRAYATHPSNEKQFFHIRNLHIGHLAKAFALRQAPKSVIASGTKNSGIKRRPITGAKITRDPHEGDAERRMKDVVRSQGRMLKKAGRMVSSGTSEFQVVSGTSLEKLAIGSRS